jgi:manganese efflux pump family protein
MLILAIATSVDAMAAGFTLTLLDINPFYACAMIGCATFCFSVAGVFIGIKSGTWLESKAELLGGVTLILIGLKILMF